MIVIDAGCLVQLIVRPTAAAELIVALGAEPDIAAPHVLDVEVIAAIRGLWLRGEVADDLVESAAPAVASFAAERFDHRGLIRRVVELRHGVRTWDAFYVALAEVLECPLWTTDTRLANASGPRCEFRVFV